MFLLCHKITLWKIPECDNYKKALDAICKTWSEVKLLQMKASDFKFYLNKNKCSKGDNTVPDPPPQFTSATFSFWQTY